MTISIVVAVSENGVIGHKNKMPWHLSADLKHFSQLTKGNAIVMGRKTFESIGKPLSKRRNFIITRDKDYKIPDRCETVASLDEAINQLYNEEEVFIIGGRLLYEEAMELNMVELIYLTRVHCVCEGDVFFPELDNDKWNLLSSKRHEKDETNEHPFSFELYQRRY